MSRQTRLTGILLVLLLTGCMPPGQRALHVQVEQNGQVVAEGLYSVPDSFDRQATWERLSKASLEAVGELTPEASDPNLVVLTGNITVELEHAGRSYAGSQTRQLRLVADPTRASFWRIEPAEVVRLGTAVK